MNLAEHKNYENLRASPRLLHWQPEKHSCFISYPFQKNIPLPDGVVHFSFERNYLEIKNRDLGELKMICFWNELKLLGNGVLSDRFLGESQYQGAGISFIGSFDFGVLHAYFIFYHENTTWPFLVFCCLILAFMTQKTCFQAIGCKTCCKSVKLRDLKPFLGLWEKWISAFNLWILFGAICDSWKFNHCLRLTSRLIIL